MAQLPLIYLTSTQYDRLTESIIGAIFEVANILGPGFLETVYHRALLNELNLRGIRAASEVPLPVFYKEQSVGKFLADILVEDIIILELKCVESLRDEHTAQCINYLRASRLKLCLLINFQKPKVEWRRIVLNF